MKANSADPPFTTAPVNARPAGDGVQRCAAWAREHHVDPIGTAGCHAGYLLLEWPLPWPQDLSEVDELAPLIAALGGTGIRLQGLVPTRDHGEGHHAILYDRVPSEGGFSRLARREVVAPLDGLVPSALALLDGSNGRGDDAPGQDILICGHGRRDRCCGSLGTALAGEMAQKLGDRDHVRTWRTSHMGGHRFAPTITILPESTVWAHADTGLVAQVLERSGPLEGLLGRYRGCSGLATPRIQALERAVLEEVGWSLLSMHRKGQELDDGVVRLEARNGSTSSRWEAVVREGRVLPVPVCGAPLGDATKSEVEWIVELLTGHDVGEDPGRARQ